MRSDLDTEVLSAKAEDKRFYRRGHIKRNSFH